MENNDRNKHFTVFGDAFLAEHHDECRARVEPLKDARNGSARPAAAVLLALLFGLTTAAAAITTTVSRQAQTSSHELFSGQRPPVFLYKGPGSIGFEDAIY